MMGRAKMGHHTMRSFIILLAALLLGSGALAQGMPQGKPPGIAAPSAQPGQPPATRARCAQPLMNGCMRMQSSCQMACPGMWSTNPSAPAFTPTDRAGCMARCGNQYRMCLIQYGCL